MNIGFESKRKPQTLAVKVQTNTPSRMVIRVRDHKKPNTFYTDRYADVTGEQTFLVKMPQSPELAIVEVFNKKNGNLPKGVDRTFQVKEIKAIPLSTTLNVWTSGNASLKSFIKFAQEFCERAAIISASLPDGYSVYKSDDGKFTVRYFDVITDHETGAPLKTPSRISQKDGTIEVAKKYFLKYTVPQRMAILLHEYSHFYLNKNKRSEIQADKNAIVIYCGLGYPVVDAANVWLEVFHGTPTEQNVARWEEMKKFMYGFNKMKHKLK